MGKDRFHCLPRHKREGQERRESAPAVSPRSPVSVAEVAKARKGQGDATKPTPTEDVLLSPAALAEMLEVNRRTVFRMADSGKLPKPIYLGSRLPRWRRSTVLAWLEGLETSGKVPEA